MALLRRVLGVDQYKLYAFPCTYRRQAVLQKTVRDAVGLSP